MAGLLVKKCKNGEKIPPTGSSFLCNENELKSKTSLTGGS